MRLSDELHLKQPITDRDHEVCLSIVRTAQLLEKEANAILQQFGLTDSQFNVLMLLRYQSGDGCLTQARLGAMMLVSPPNVTGLIDRLEKAGHVARGHDPADRRVRLVRLTTSGRRLFDKAEVAYRNRLTEIMKGFSKRHSAVIAEALSEIRDHIT